MTDLWRAGVTATVKSYNNKSDSHSVLTSFEYVSEDVLVLLAGRAVPSFVAELILTLLDAFVRTIRHRVDDARMLHAYLDLCRQQGGQCATYDTSLSQGWIVNGTGLGLLLLQRWRNTHQPQIPKI